MNKIFKKNASMFSIKNILLILMLVSLIMGFHIWIVCKALSVLGDVTTIIVVNHGKRLIKSWPDESIYILNWDKQLDTQKNSYSCCSSPKCILTKDKNYFGNDYKLFDAMLFSEIFLESKNRPERNTNMLNIFTSTQAENQRKVCDKYYDDFFNLTFTYRLDSDIVWKHFVVRDISGAVIAPNLSPAWNNSSSHVIQRIKSIIKRKTKAVAYIDSDCKLENLTTSYLSELEKHLNAYTLKINKYSCLKECGRQQCNTVLKNDYFFYIIFEDYFTEDYVSKKVLQAYDNYVVPIIYGGANYSRFLPPHSYIDGRVANLRDVAKEINESLLNYTKYEEYFKWKNSYTIESYQPFCELCEALSKPVSKTGKKDFRQWWYGKDSMELCSVPQLSNNTKANDKHTKI